MVIMVQSLSLNKLCIDLLRIRVQGLRLLAIAALFCHFLSNPFAEQITRIRYQIIFGLDTLRTPVVIRTGPEGAQRRVWFQKHRLLH